MMTERKPMDERVAYIDSLPASKRQRILELLHRGDTLNMVLSQIEDHPVRYEGLQREMENLLRQERDEAYALLAYTERAFGVPEVGVPELD
jgi:hypothetical protein